MKTIFYTLILVFCICTPSMAMIELTSDTQEYAQYEPITLIMELYGTLEGDQHFGDLTDMGTFYTLEIQYEHEASYKYTSSIHVESMGKGLVADSVIQSVIVSSGGHLITQKPGYYRLQLVNNKDGSYISNPLIVNVRVPQSADEEAQIEDIQTHKKAYALFVNLEGGDHIDGGQALFKRLASKNTHHGRMAKGYLALNYSQDYFDMKGNRNKNRLANMETVADYLEGIDGRSDEAIITMKAVRNFKSIKKVDRLSARLQKKLKKVQQRFAHQKIMKSKIHRSIVQ